jgi:hypothetical protein
MALDCRFVVSQAAALTGVHDRKGSELGGLRSRAIGSEHGEMAVQTLGKAPFGASFRPFFEDLLRVFLRASPRGRKLARKRLSKASILENPALLSLVRPDFEPDPKVANQCHFSEAAALSELG